jgi:hypothetical protein
VQQNRAAQRVSVSVFVQHTDAPQPQKMAISSTGTLLPSFDGTAFIAAQNFFDFLRTDLLTSRTNRCIIDV